MPINTWWRYYIEPMSPFVLTKFVDQTIKHPITLKSPPMVTTVSSHTFVGFIFISHLNKCCYLPDLYSCQLSHFTLVSKYSITAAMVWMQQWLWASHCFLKKCETGIFTQPVVFFNTNCTGHIQFTETEHWENSKKEDCKRGKRENNRQY